MGVPVVAGSAPRPSTSKIRFRRGGGGGGHVVPVAVGESLRVFVERIRVDGRGATGSPRRGEMDARGGMSLEREGDGQGGPRGSPRVVEVVERGGVSLERVGGEQRGGGPDDRDPGVVGRGSAVGTQRIHLRLGGREGP